MFADFSLLINGLPRWTALVRHDFAFNEAISIVNCDTQEEIDTYWERLAVPEAEQCGWLEDRFGLSWQVAPTAMDEMMQSGTSEQIARHSSFSQHEEVRPCGTKESI